MNQLSVILKNGRSAKGLSQQEVAQLSGIKSQRTYAYYENGDREPDLPTLKRIVKTLEIENALISYILDQNGPTTPLGKKNDESSAIYNVDFLAGRLSSKDEVIQAKDEVVKVTERRAEELKGDKQVLQHIIDKQFNLIEGCIRDVGQDTWRVLVYQHAWVEFFSETLSGGDKKKKTELMERMGKMLNDRLEAANKAGKGQGAGKARKEDKRES